MKKFVAKRTFGEYKLAEIEVLRETEHVLIIDENHFVPIYGDFYHLPERLDRNEYHFFEDKNEALYWLRNELEDYYDKLCIKSQKIAADIQEIERKRMTPTPQIFLNQWYLVRVVDNPVALEIYSGPFDSEQQASEQVTIPQSGKYVLIQGSEIADNGWHVLERREIPKE